MGRKVIRIAAIALLCVTVLSCALIGTGLLAALFMTVVPNSGFWRWRDFDDDLRPGIWAFNAFWAIAGGLVSAFVYELLRVRSERRKWRRTTHVGASVLVGQAIGIAGIIGARIADYGGTPPVVRDWRDVSSLRRAFLTDPRLLEDTHVPDAMNDFVSTCWEIVRTMPSLRDDAELVEQCVQASSLDYNWAGLSHS